MNKQKFVELLRTPEKMSKTDLLELETLTKNNPYFQSGHIALARGSRLLKFPSFEKKINTAAIYTTSRNNLKHYMQGRLIISKSINPKSVPSSKKGMLSASHLQQKTSRSVNVPEKTSQLLSKTDHDLLIDEIYSNLNKWKKSRDYYLEYEKTIEEKFQINSDIENIDDTVEKIKNQMTGEIIAEETIVSNPLKESQIIDDKEAFSTKKTKVSKKEKPEGEITRQSVESEDFTKDVSSKIDDEINQLDDSSKNVDDGIIAKKKLHLTPNTDNINKNFRLSILNRNIRMKANLQSRIKKENIAKKKVESNKIEEEKVKKKPKLKNYPTSISKHKVIEDQKKIVESFLKKNPSIDIKKDSNTFENQDLSLVSENFPDDIVTENIAQILENQDKIDLAISVYDKLIILYPEQKNQYEIEIERLKSKYNSF